MSRFTTWPPLTPSLQEKENTAFCFRAGGESLSSLSGLFQHHPVGEGKHCLPPVGRRYKSRAPMASVDATLVRKESIACISQGMSKLPSWPPNTAKDGTCFSAWCLAGVGWVLPKSSILLNCFFSCPLVRENRLFSSVPVGISGMWASLEPSSGYTGKKEHSEKLPQCHSSIL